MLRRILGILTASALFACGGDPLPESYGVYAIDGGELIELKELGEDAPILGENTPDLGSSVRLVIFDKFVESPMFDPEELIPVNRMFRVRSIFNQWVEKPDTPAVKTKVSVPDLGPATWVEAAKQRFPYPKNAIGRDFEVRYSPGENPQMLFVESETEFEPGLYLFAGKYVFTVNGEDADTEMDLHVKTAAGKARTNWMALTSGKKMESNWEGWHNTPREVEDRRVVTAEYLACSVGDGLLDALEGDAAVALAAGDILKARDLVSTISVIRPIQDLKKDLAQAAASAASRARSVKKWREAIQFSEVAIEFGDNSASNKDLLEEALGEKKKEERIAAARKAEEVAAEAVRRDAELRRLARLLEDSKVETKAIDTFAVRHDRYSAVVTDVRVKIVDAKETRSRSYWYGDFRGGVSPTRSFSGYRVMFARAAPEGSTGGIRNPSIIDGAEFDDETSATRFSQVLQEALDQWHAKYGEILE